MAQIGSEGSGHANRLSAYKAEVLKELPSLFDPEHGMPCTLQEAHQDQIQELYAESGQLTTQVNWLTRASIQLFQSHSQGETHTLKLALLCLDKPAHLNHGSLLCREQRRLALRAMIILSDRQVKHF